MIKMNIKRKFIMSMILLQIFFVIMVVLLVNGLIQYAAAQTSSTDTSYVGQLALGAGIGAGIAIGGAGIGAGIAIQTTGTAAISVMMENESAFFKAFLIVALGEALAIYGLIISILLWIKIP